VNTILLSRLLEMYVVQQSLHDGNLIRAESGILLSNGSHYCLCWQRGEGERGPVRNFHLLMVSLEGGASPHCVIPVEDQAPSG